MQRLRASDAILHAGDFTSPEILALIASFGPPVHAVHGNVDGPGLRALLPAARVVELGGARIGLVHDAGPATGRLARLRRRFPDADAVVFGHSHLPQHESDGGFQSFNPGSPTERRRAPAHTMGMAVVEAGQVTFSLVELP